VFEGRENRKKSTAPVPASERATHEAVGVLKKLTFLTYTVKSKKNPAPPRGGTSPGEISTSPGLVATNPGLVASRRRPDFRCPVP
jgi:hypothetical protein